MADRKTRRAQARQARKNARRQRSRQARARGRDTSFERATRWPFREAWIGEDWHETTAVLPAYGLRQHDDGRSAWLLLEVDLTDGAILEASVHTGTDSQARQAIVAFLGDRTVLETTPGSLAALWALAAPRNLTLPDAADRVEAFLSDQDPAGADLDLALGVETPTDPGPVEPTPGPIRRLLRRLLGGA